MGGEWRRLELAWLGVEVRLQAGRVEFSGFDWMAERVAWEMSGVRPSLEAVALLVLGRSLEAAGESGAEALLERLGRHQLEAVPELRAVFRCTGWTVPAGEQVPQELWRWLASAPEIHARVSVAQSGEAPGEVLLGLSRDGADPVLEAVAANPGTPPVALEQMSRTAYPELLTRLLQNPACSPELLELMAEDPSAAARRSLRFRFPIGLVRFAVGALTTDIRRAVVSNPSTPERALGLLARGSDEAADRARARMEGLGLQL